MVLLIIVAFNVLICESTNLLSQHVHCVVRGHTPMKELI